MTFYSPMLLEFGLFLVEKAKFKIEALLFCRHSLQAIAFKQGTQHIKSVVSRMFHMKEDNPTVTVTHPQNQIMLTLTGASSNKCYNSKGCDKNCKYFFTFLQLSKIFNFIIAILQSARITNNISLHCLLLIISSITIKLESLAAMIERKM